MRGTDAMMVKIQNRISRYLVPYRVRRMNRVYRETRRHIRETEFLSREELDSYHLQRLRQLLYYCRINIPYYGKVLGSLGFSEKSLNSLDDLRNIPILTKKDLKENLEELTVQGRFRKGVSYGSTGGTTGEPVGFYSFRSRLQSIENAFVDDIWERSGYSVGDPLAVLRGALIGKPAKDGRFWSKSAGDPRCNLSTFHLTPDSSIHYADLMERGRIRYLHCFPSSVLTFYKCLLQASHPVPRIRTIFTSSEVLSPSDREYIERVSGAEIIDLYGSSERVVIAGECAMCRQYHVYPQYGYYELLDDSGSPVTEPGDSGTVIGTSYGRLATPLLRYEIGDMAVYGATRGLCGRSYTSVERILGRQVEYVYSESGREVSMSLMNVHSREFDALLRFQFVQEDPGRVEFHYVPLSDFSEDDREAVKRLLEEKLGDGFHLVMRREEMIPRAANGKHRLLVQSMSRN